MKHRLYLAAAIGFVSAGAVMAEAVDPAEVEYGEYGAVEASISGEPGNVDAGRDVLSSKSKGNCLACHMLGALEEIPFHGEIGPPLDGAADRWTEAELRGIVADAKKTFEGTMMPSFYKSSGYIRPGDAYTGKAGTEPLPPLLSAQEIEDVVAYLLTLKDQ